MVSYEFSTLTCLINKRERIELQQATTITHSLRDRERENVPTCLHPRKEQNMKEHVSELLCFCLLFIPENYHTTHD